MQATQPQQQLQTTKNLLRSGALLKNPPNCKNLHKTNKVFESFRYYAYIIACFFKINIIVFTIK
jgi:hypothetical protein